MVTCRTERGNRELNSKTASSIQEAWSQSLAEVITIIASFAVLVSYFQHLMIALQTGYPIILISPGPWDFVSGLLQGLPFLSLMPFCFERVYPAYRTWRSQVEQHSRSAFSVGMSSVVPLILFAVFLMGFGVFLISILKKALKLGLCDPTLYVEAIPEMIGMVALSLVTIRARSISQKIGASTLLRSFLNMLSQKIGAATLFPSFLNMLVSVISVVGWTVLLIAAIAVLDASAHLIPFIRISWGMLRPLMALIVLCTTAYRATGTVPEEDKTTSHHMDSFRELCMKAQSMGGLGKCLLVVVLAVFVGLASASFGLSNKIIVHRSSSGETVENSSEEEKYRLLDVFGGSRAVVARESRDGGDREFRVINLDNDFWISS